MKTKIAIFLFLLSASTVFSNSGFRENNGQFRNEIGQPSQAVRFLLHCKGFNVQLRKDGFSYDFYKNIEDSVILNRVDFVFENFNPSYTTLKELPTQPYITTFVSDKKNPSFEKIIYSQFYPGIDLVFKRKNNDQFEYDFVINENGNVNDIQFKISGAEIIATEPSAITLQTPIALFKEWIPLSYDHRLKKIDVTFENMADNHFKFFYAGKAKKFTIDPTPQLIYATYSGEEWNISKAQFLENGDYICAGSTGTLQNTITETSYQNQLIGETNATLCRFDTSNNLVWFTYFGSNSTSAQDMFIQNGIIAIAGSTNSLNLPAEEGFQPNFEGGLFDGYYALFNESGSFIHCSYLGGSNIDQITTIVPVNNDLFAVTGITRSSNFPSENSNASYSGGQDAFISFFNTNNGFCLYSSVFGGSLDETIRGIIPTQEGKYLFFGDSNSSSFNQSGSESLPSMLSNQNSSTAQDGIIGLIDSNLTLSYIGYYGGQGGDYLLEGTINNDGKIVLISTEGETDIPFTANAENTILDGTSSGMIITILDSELNTEYRSLLSPRLGNSSQGFSTPLSVHVDLSNFIYISGTTDLEEFISTTEAFQEQKLEYPLNNVPDDDGFILKLNPVGYKVWGTYLGEYSYDEVKSLDIFNSKILVAGGISSTANYPEEYQYSFVTSDAFQFQLNSWGGYIAIFDDVVNVSELNSIDETLLLFPNPALENIFVGADFGENPLYFINDIAGKRVLQGNLNTSNINISQIPKGMYMLSISTKQGFKTAKFVKQ